MDLAQARRNMVDNQLRTNQVSDPLVLDAMMAVPREHFVPSDRRGVAYVDEDLALGQGRFLMEPMVLGRLLQAALIQPTDVALEIGCATGYGTAVLARMASTAIGQEETAEAAARAMALIGELGVDNVATVTGPLVEGYPAQAPYDVILISGAVQKVPQVILEQVAEGGRLVTVLASDGRPGNKGQAVLYQRDGGIIGRRILFDASTRPLAGFFHEPAFVF